MKRVCLFMTLICMMMVSFKPDGSDGKHEGHGYVDLGLSVKWATCNVGASKPEDYGNYYAWGETTTKSSYTESNSKTYGKKMGDFAGNSSYDAATANWGGNWRMPTEKEMRELIDKCTWIWTTQNGVKGYNVKGPNGNSIFLPAAGSWFGSVGEGAGSGGDYWGSAPYDNIADYSYFFDSFYDDSDDYSYFFDSFYDSFYDSYSYFFGTIHDHAYILRFHSGYHGMNGYDRIYGRSVRPVVE
ncbi:MAG: hypothetical protein IIW55_04020 [Bacteroidales bacterium]|nr:hypothetical protein [Bacteroidales bacterium]